MVDAQRFQLSNLCLALYLAQSRLYYVLAGGFQCIIPHPNRHRKGAYDSVSKFYYILNPKRREMAV